MPPDARNRIKARTAAGALISVLPDLKVAGWVVRSSTSAGLYRTDTESNCAGRTAVMCS